MGGLQHWMCVCARNARKILACVCFVFVCLFVCLRRRRLAAGGVCKTVPVCKLFVCKKSGSGGCLQIVPVCKLFANIGGFAPQSESSPRE